MTNLANNWDLIKQQYGEELFLIIQKQHEELIDKIKQHQKIATRHDAANPSLAAESRFDLAYNAAHSLSLAALRWHGYRSSNRYLVFQVLPHTIGVGPEVWRVLAKCHDCRCLNIK